MASPHESIEENENKAVLTQAQLEDLAAKTGLSEEKVRELYDDMREEFPAGGITEEEFTELCNEDSDGNNHPFLTPKKMFEIIDRDNSVDQADVVDLWSAYLRLIHNNDGSDEDDGNVLSLEKIKSSVSKCFGDKTQLTEQEFCEAFAKNEDLDTIFPNIQSFMWNGLSVITTKYS